MTDGWTDGQWLMDGKWMDSDEVGRVTSIEKENLILCLQERLLKEAA